MEDLRKLLLDVKQARIDEAVAKENKKNILSSPLVLEVLDDYDNKRGATAHAIKALKDYALAWVMLNSGEKLEYGVKTRKITKLIYTVKDAFEWCKINFVAALTVDKKKFEKYVKAADEKPDFVDVETVVTITIPADLSGLE